MTVPKTAISAWRRRLVDSGSNAISFGRMSQSLSFSDQYSPIRESVEETAHENI